MENTSISIRKASGGDSGELLRLLQQISALHSALRPDIFKAGSKYDLDTVNDMIADSQNLILVAEREGNGALAGYVIAQIIDRIQNGVIQARRFLYIDDFCVDKDIRSAGIGSLLFKSIKDYATELKISDIELNVWEDNEGALKFYQKLGFSTQRRQLELKI